MRTNMNINRKGNRMNDGRGPSRIGAGVMPRLDIYLRWAFMGLAAGVIGWGLGASPVAAAGEVTVSNACDTLVTGVGGGGNVEVKPGDTVRLTGPQDHVCIPDFDTTTGELLAGDGMAINAKGTATLPITIDLDGHSIRSDSNVAADADAFGLDVENAGLSLGGENIRVINSSTKDVSVIDNFTANIDIGKCKNCTVQGTLINGASNILVGESHGGGGIAIDKSQGITLDTVDIVDEQLGEAPVGGDNGIDWKRCTGPGNVLKNSSLKAPLAGLRFRGCKGNNMLKIQYSSFTADPAMGVGIEFTRDVEGVTLTGNDIGSTGEGVVVGGLTKNIKFNTPPSADVATRNMIHDNAVCGVTIKPTADLDPTKNSALEDADLLANNDFSNVANICHK